MKQLQGLFSAAASQAKVSTSYGAAEPITMNFMQTSSTAQKVDGRNINHVLSGSNSTPSPALGHHSSKELSSSPLNI